MLLTAGNKKSVWQIIIFFQKLHLHDSKENNPTLSTILRLIFNSEVHNGRPLALFYV